jgi:hypothetical protein
MEKDRGAYRVRWGWTSCQTPCRQHCWHWQYGTVARRRGSNGYEDAMASMVDDITRGTTVNQSFIGFQMHVIGIQGLPDRGCKQRSASSRWTRDGEATSS